MAYATREGVRMCDEQAGAGAPTCVFVRSWCGDRTPFEPRHAGHPTPTVEQFVPAV